jgi:hypothetical protein
MSKNYSKNYVIYAILVAILALAFIAYSVLFVSNQSNVPCLASVNYYCINPYISNATGLMTFTYSQINGFTQYNVSLTCAEVQDPAGFPYIVGGNPNTTNIGNIVSGQESVISNIQCYNNSGNLIRGPLRKGTKFDLIIWESYFKNGTRTMLVIGKAQVNVI